MKTIVTEVPGLGRLVGVVEAEPEPWDRDPAEEWIRGMLVAHKGLQEQEQLSAKDQELLDGLDMMLGPAVTEVGELDGINGINRMGVEERTVCDG